MRPNVRLVAVMAIGFALPLVSGAATLLTGDLRHIATLVLTQAAEEAFEELDTNRDGYIDREEATQSAQVWANFDQIDANGDGRISPEEWLAHHRAS